MPAPSICMKCFESPKAIKECDHQCSSNPNHTGSYHCVHLCDRCCSDA